MRVIECNPQTKEEWSWLLEYLYHHWRKRGRLVTFYPSGYCRGALRLDGIIGGKSIGQLTH